MRKGGNIFVQSKKQKVPASVKPLINLEKEKDEINNKVNKYLKELKY